MPVVYYQGLAGLTLSLVRSTTPEGTTTSTALAETTRPGLYKATVTAAAAGDTATVLIGTAPFDGGTIQNVDGVLWFVARARGTAPAVFPIVATVNGGPVPPTCLIAYRRAAMTHRITVTNADGTLPDLSGKTLVFVASTEKGKELIFVETVTVTGDANNVIAVELTGEHNDQAAGVYRYGVWEGEYPNGRLWAQGDYIVEPVGGPHVAV